METEKVCANLTPVELGKIDTLVAQGVFTTRTDVIRAGIRRVLEEQASVLDQGIQRVLDEHAGLEGKVISGGSGIGVFRITRNQLEKARDRQQRVRIAVIGMVSLADDISVDLADATIDRIRVFGSLRGPKAVLEQIEERVARDLSSWE